MVWGMKGGPVATRHRQSRGANQRGLASLAFIGVLAQGLGLLLFILACYLIFEKARTAHAAARQAEQASRVVQELADHISGLQSLLRQSSLQRLAVTALNAPDQAEGQNQAAMTVALKRQNPAARVVRVYPAPASQLSLDDVGGNYMLLELLLSAETQQQSPFMLITSLDGQQRGERRFAHATSLSERSDGPVVGYLVAEWDEAVVLDNFTPMLDKSRFFALQHAAGNRDFINLKASGNAPTAWFGADRLPIAGTRMYVSIPDQPRSFDLGAQRTLLLTVVLGALLMAGGFIWYRRASAPAASRLPADLDVGSAPAFKADARPKPAGTSIRKSKRKKRPQGISVTEMDKLEDAGPMPVKSEGKPDPDQPAKSAGKARTESVEEDAPKPPQDTEDVWLVPPPELAEEKPEPKKPEVEELPELSLADEWQEPAPEPKPEPESKPKPKPEPDAEPKQFGLRLEDEDGDDGEQSDTSNSNDKPVGLKPPTAQHPDLEAPPPPPKSLEELELEEAEVEDTETDTRNRDNKD